jgi:predicted ester cyclase
MSLTTESEVDAMSSDVTTDMGQEAGVPTTAAEMAAASRRLLEEGFNAGRVDLVDALVAPEAINHDPAEPAAIRAMRGPAVFKRTISMYRAAFPDVHVTVDDVIAAEDKVVLRWHSEGTHHGALEGLAPTRVHGRVTGISIDKWSGGKIVESWSEWDNLGLARQLGAAPPEGSMGEKLGIHVQHLMARRMRKKAHV